ncbi:MAG: hypothetical protein AAGA42_11400, partial [Actinomycetota bacterium]
AKRVVVTAAAGTGIAASERQRHTTNSPSGTSVWLPLRGPGSSKLKARSTSGLDEVVGAAVRRAGADAATLFDAPLPPPAAGA